MPSAAKTAAIIFRYTRAYRRANPGKDIQISYNGNGWYELPGSGNVREAELIRMTTALDRRYADPGPMEVNQPVNTGERRVFWVCYNETIPLQAGGERTGNSQHFGTEDLKAAKAGCDRLRELASMGKHIGSGTGCINSAWIEEEVRTLYDY